MLILPLCIAKAIKEKWKQLKKEKREQSLNAANTGTNDQTEHESQEPLPNLSQDVIQGTSHRCKHTSITTTQVTSQFQPNLSVRVVSLQAVNSETLKVIVRGSSYVPRKHLITFTNNRVNAINLSNRIDTTDSDK